MMLQEEGLGKDTKDFGQQAEEKYRSTSLGLAKRKNDCWGADFGKRMRFEGFKNRNVRFPCFAIISQIKVFRFSPRENINE